MDLSKSDIVVPTWLQQSLAGIAGNCSATSPTTWQLPNRLNDFFTEVHALDGANAEARCLSCNRFLKFSKKATSNLVTHLKRCNVEGFEQYLKVRGKKERSSYGHATSASSSAPSKKSNALDFDDFAQKRLVKALVKSIACDQLPLEIVDRPSFRELLHSCEPRFNIPYSTHLREIILPDTTALIDQAIRIETVHMTSVCLTIDLWSACATHSFLAITMHFIDRNFELKARLLNCTAFPGRLTAPDVRGLYEKTLRRFSLHDKAIKLTTDSAPFELKGISLLYFNWSPGDYAWKSVRRCDNVTDIDLPTDMSVVEDVFSQLPRRVWNFGHSLRLVVKDGLDLITESATSVVRDVLDKTAERLNSIKQSVAACEWLQLNGQTTLSEMTANGLTFHLKMLRFVTTAPQVVNSALSLVTNEPAIYFTELELSVLSELVAVLEPVEEALGQVEARTTTTVSAVCPIVKGLQTELLKMTTSDRVQHCQLLAIALVQSIERRLVRTYFENDDYRLASVLDPRFKLDWIDNDSEKIRMMRILADRVKQKVVLLSRTAKEDSDIRKMNEDTPPSPKKPKIFSFLGPSTTQAGQGASSKNALKDIENYFGEGRQHVPDVISYWKERNCDKLLTDIVREVLAVTATSPPAEKAFQTTDDFLQFEEDEVESDTFRSLLLIKHNKELYANLQ